MLVTNGGKQAVYQAFATLLDPGDEALLAASADELSAPARAVRAAAHGTRVTFSPKVFIPLTMLCRDRCGYCTFSKPPARLGAPYLDADEVLAIATAGAAVGCHEALFTLGERPELRYPAASAWLEAHGYATTLEYLRAMAALVIEETGLLPHLNAGALLEDELAALRPVSVSQGTMLESLDPDLACHRGSPDKTPARRLATLEAAGRLRIPFTTGVLVGIGDDRRSRLGALRAIAAAHAVHGHVQEVLVQGFLPKPDTAMHASPACSLEELTWTIAAARLVLPPEVHVQSPPNLVEDLAALLDAGADDLGGVSPVTIDHVNPERAWPALAALEATVEAAGGVLAPRLAVHPAWALDPATWLDPALQFPVLDRSDAEGLARDSAWVSGGDVPPPVLVETPGTAGATRSAGPGRAGLGRAGEILEARRRREVPGPAGAWEGVSGAGAPGARPAAGHRSREHTRLRARDPRLESPVGPGLLLPSADGRAAGHVRRARRSGVLGEEVDHLLAHVARHDGGDEGREAQGELTGAAADVDRGHRRGRRRLLEDALDDAHEAGVVPRPVVPRRGAAGPEALLAGDVRAAGTDLGHPSDPSRPISGRRGRSRSSGRPGAPPRRRGDGRPRRS